MVMSEPATAIQSGAADPTEAALVDAALADPAAFGLLYERYYPRVYRYIRTLTASQEDGSDLTQAVFIQAWTRLASYRRQASFATWLFRIAHNQVMDAHRRQRDVLSWDDLPEDGHATDADGVEEQMLQRESLARLGHMLAGLDEEKRTLLLLRFAAQLSIPEIAGVVGKQPEAVKKQIARTLHALKERYHAL